MIHRTVGLLFPRTRSFLLATNEVEHVPFRIALVVQRTTFVDEQSNYVRRFLFIPSVSEPKLPKSFGFDFWPVVKRGRFSRIGAYHPMVPWRTVKIDDMSDGANQAHSIVR